MILSVIYLYLISHIRLAKQRKKETIYVIFERIGNLNTLKSIHCQQKAFSWHNGKYSRINGHLNTLKIIYSQIMRIQYKITIM